MIKRNRYSAGGGGIAKIGDVIPQLIVRYGLHRHRNLEQIEEAWRQVVGEQYAFITQIEKLQRGILTIKVPHNAIIQELSFRHSELVDALDPLIAGEKIKKIRFVL